MNAIRIFILLILSFTFIYGCATKANIAADGGFKKTETEYGWRLTGLVGKEINIENTSVYGLLSYHRYSLITGHDNLFQLGVQEDD